MQTTCNQWCGSYTLVIGRVLLSALFIYAGYNKLLDLLQHQGAGVIAVMQNVGIPAAGMPLLILVIALELLGGLMLAVGFKARYTALAIAIFTLLATYFFHRSANQIIEALKNLSIIGGLLYIVDHGAGPLSIDAWCAKKQSNPTVN